MSLSFDANLAKSGPILGKLCEEYTNVITLFCLDQSVEQIGSKWNKELLSNFRVYRKSAASAKTDGGITADGSLYTGIRKVSIEFKFKYKSTFRIEASNLNCNKDSEIKLQIRIRLRVITL